jgi:galacturonosyltransferase
MSNKRILILANSLLGLYSFRREVIHALIAEGYEVILSVPKDDHWKERHYKYFEKMGCSFVVTNFKRKGINPLADLKLILFYLRLIRKERPAVVLTYTIKPNAYGGIACAWCGVPQIANITGLGAAVENGGLLGSISTGIYCLGLRRARLVFCQNVDNLGFCKKHGITKGEVKLLPGSGVNLQYHSYTDYPSETEPVRFLFCGRIRREKGIDEFLEAAKYFKEHPVIEHKIEFHVAGPCEEAYNERLRQMTEQGVVVYHGQQDDVRPFYRLAAMTVLPSFYPEGMSNVLLESQATGRPVLTTGRAGCGETVDDGVTGFIVKAQDCHDVIAKLITFMQKPYSEHVAMGVAARQKMEREFSRDLVIKAYLESIEKVKR